MSVIVATGKRGRPKGSVGHGIPKCSGTIYEHQLSPEQQKQYIKDKIKVLKDFCITLTYEEEKELRSMNDPLSIDVYVRRLIAKRWN